MCTLALVSLLSARVALATPGLDHPMDLASVMRAADCQGNPGPECGVQGDQAGGPIELSFIQMQVERLRGKVSELAPTTISAGPPQGEATPFSKCTSDGTQPLVVDGGHLCNQTDFVPLPEEPEEEEDMDFHMNYHVSFMQTALTKRNPPNEMESLNAVGIEDEDEALGLLDAAADLGMSV
eukprot:CAMPEP_0179338294 /NCGR_PEP_ID=MMETSP0797-20121207/68102_1 /TAXON_ID=47934 /ORGANISM="Dinophysis acuminata, Strain DAEP01" /LENGTH=180 /DNA_ID=CAMNT_0021052043 /DNA_START=24 /DNA_END=566 /DNA_ORIENTATION=+